VAKPAGKARFNAALSCESKGFSIRRDRDGKKKEHPQVLKISGQMRR
jgi:hypothetical protein